MLEVRNAVEAAKKNEKAVAPGMQSQKEQSMGMFATEDEVSEKVDHAINVVLVNLDKRVIDMAEQRIIDTSVSCDSGHSRVCVRRAAQNAPENLLAFILQAIQKSVTPLRWW